MPETAYELKLAPLLCMLYATESPTKEMLTDKRSESSTAAEDRHEQQSTDKLIVETDGPDNDKPDTTASMRKLVFCASDDTCSTCNMALVHRHACVRAASMFEQSLEGWRLIGQGVQSLLTCSCFTGVQPARNMSNQLRSGNRGS